MLVQLKCKACDSQLKMESDGKTFICESCGSRYIFAEQEHSEVIAHFSAAAEERKRQIEQAAAERQREIDEENERESRRLAEVDQKAYWIRNKLCRHCGGEFEGRLLKKCKNCGKSKDY